nr:uncharacterized protein LOC109149905 [Ipomoea trifida]
MSNLRNTHDEDAKWLDSTLVVFLDIVYDRIKQHPNGQPVFKSSSWNEMSQELKDKTGCVYTGTQLSGKYNRCKDLHRRFLEVLNHTGVTFNAETNKAEADDAVWESFFKPPAADCPSLHAPRPPETQSPPPKTAPRSSLPENAIFSTENCSTLLAAGKRKLLPDTNLYANAYIRVYKGLSIQRYALPSPVAPPPTVVSPPIVAPVSTGSPIDLPISSPSDSTVPPTSSSVEGSSIGPDLPIVHVEEGRLIPSHKCSTTMKKIFMQRIYPEGYTWKKIPNDYKESYFEEFKKFYKWDASIDRHVRKAFQAQAGIRPDVKAKSEQQRKNRMSEVAGPGTGCSRHTGGSRSAIEHYHKLEEIQARHDAATQEVEGSIEPPVINMSQLYVDVVGGVKKQRIYGLGTKASSFINSNSCSSSATSQFHQDTMKEMLDTMRVMILDVVDVV